MEKLILILIVLLHYLLILYVHLKFGRPKKEKQATCKKLIVIWVKDWLLTPIIILSVVVYLLGDYETGWKIISFSPNNFVRWLGGSIITLGFVLKYFAYRSLGRNWSAKCNIYNDHELVKTGPYKFLRHPVYMSYLLTFVGFGFMSGNLLSFIFAIAYHSLNSLRANHEEKMLRAKFGNDYNVYLMNSDLYCAPVVMISIIISTIIGGVDEIICLFTGNSFTLLFTCKVWELLSS